MNRVIESYSEFVKSNQVNEAKGNAKYLTSKFDVFMIKFQFSNDVFFFENESNELAVICKKEAKNDTGIEYIKRFEGDKFVKMNKALIIQLFGTNTENQVELERMGIK